MNLQLYLTKQEYLLAAECLKQSNSADYSKGFDAGANFALEYLKEILDCQRYLLQNLDVEY